MSGADSMRAWRVALAGMVSLGVAMGVGRFAFTPLLPVMLQERVIDLPAASWLASINYLAYMVGALLCTLQPWVWARFRQLPSVAYSTAVRAGLVATSLLTLAMAMPVPAAWPGLRFCVGVASAVVFVFTSGWCLSRLAQLGAPALGGVIFAGPGLGIVISGLVGGGMVAWNWTAASGWLIFGLLAVVLTASVWHILQGSEERLVPMRRQGTVSRSGAAPRSGQAVAPVPARQTAAGADREIGFLALAYGLAGFGYIITATFLPVIAREALPGSAWLDLFWPIFGSGVVIGALLATRVASAGDRRYLLAGAYLVQAAGIGASLWRPTLAGFAIGSLVLGVPFTAITFFAMQEVRRLRGGAAASFIGLLTATYGVGQIIGPALVAFLLARSATPGSGFTLSLQIAAGALACGAALYLWMIRAFPIGPGTKGTRTASGRFA